MVLVGSRIQESWTHDKGNREIEVGILCETENKDEYFLCCCPNKYLYPPQYVTFCL